MAKGRVDEAALGRRVTLLGREAGQDRDRRFTVLTSGLHCGEGLDLVVHGKVLAGRVEYSDWLGWYWVWEGETGPPYCMPLVLGMTVALPERKW